MMELTAYSVNGDTGMKPIPGPPARPWMDEAIERAPYRCLPMVIANQHGWLIHAPESFACLWDGRQGPEGVRLAFADTLRTAAPWASSHFGEATVTFNFPWMFRAPKGVNLWFKGPANYIKDGIQPLEGIVEADWLPFTTTMNWRITRVGELIRFEKGEPICMILPIERGYIEKFTPAVKMLADDPELAASYRAWQQSRAAFTQAQHDGELGAPDRLNELERRIMQVSHNHGVTPQEAVVILAKEHFHTRERKWQRDYMRGRCPNGDAAADHQTKLNLREFK